MVCFLIGTALEKKYEQLVVKLSIIAMLVIKTIIIQLDPGFGKTQNLVNDFFFTHSIISSSFLTNLHLS
jgi:hypothetical protein